MTSTVTRRDAIKAGAGFVIGAGLVGGAGSVEAAHSDRAALLAWENAITDASTRGEAWVREARHLYCFVLFALQQAEAAAESVLLESLRPALAEVEAIQTERLATFQAWADEAWALPELAPWPPEPWR